MNNNKNILYGIVGLILGLVIAGSAFYYNKGSENSNLTSQQGKMHQMADGTMMESAGMDMSSMMNSMTEGLKGKSGDAFDKEFLEEMIVHHQGAVDMAREVLKTSKRPELVKLANDIIVAQTKEITMMQGWQKAWFK